MFPLEKVFHQSQMFHYIVWIYNLGTLQRNTITVVVVDTFEVKLVFLSYFWHLLRLLVFWLYVFL